MKYIILIFILLCFSVSFGQEIKRYPVNDFGGGLVNSFKNARLQDNMSTVLIDYNIDQGDMVRRKGSTALYRDSLEGILITKLIPYYVGREKSLLQVRWQPGYSRLDTDPDSSTNLLTLCDPATGQCSTLVDDFIYFPRRFRGQPYNISTAIVNNRLIIASSKTEMSLYTPEAEFPARPLAPGQPEALAIDSGGNVNGTHSYKYAWIDETVADTSFFSPRSWPVTVSNGKIYLRFETMSDTTLQDKVVIFRKNADSSSYKIVTSFAPDDTVSVITYVDNIAEGSLGAASGRDFSWDITACSKEVASPNSVPSPGRITISFNDVGQGDTVRLLRHIGTLFDTPPLDSLKEVALSYTMAFIDSAGRTSNYSAISCAEWTTTDGGNAIDTGFTVSLTNIPVPVDSSIIAKIIIRKLTAFPYATGTFNQLGLSSWRVIATIDPVTTSLTDASISADSGFVGDAIVPNSLTSDYEPDPETVTEDDSLISFKPTSIVYHGSRLWAIGDPDNRNRLYFSDFGRPTALSSGAFLSFPSRAGDWLVNMISMSNEEMFIFLQNSVFGLKGLSFYQFFADKVAVGVGLSARRTLARGSAGVFYVHKSGVYRFGQPASISIPIQNSVDSVSSQLPYSFGTTVHNEYWWSVNGKTYVYSDIPSAHWKTYSMNITDMVLFDTDTTALDYETADWVLAMNDSLYQWGDCDTCTTDGGIVFKAKYQSKAFFEDGEQREQIHYIDIQGSGSVDSLEVMVIDALGTDTVFTDTVSINFTGENRNRVAVRKIVKDCTVRIQDFGTGNYRIQGYVIGWKPNDGGRM